MRDLARISSLLHSERKPAFILDKKAPGTSYYASVDGTEIAISYHYTKVDETAGYELHVWPKKVMQDGIEWEYLSHGSFNVAYRSKDGTHVLKIPRYTNKAADFPTRAVRLWNELNPTLPSKTTQDGTGWIAPYIDGTEPTQAEVISKLIDIYWTTGRIVVDASSCVSGTTLGNFKKVTLTDGSHRIVCIDPGAAVLLTEETFSRSQTSLNFWKNSNSAYDAFLAKTARSDINHFIKALLYIDRHLPDYRVQLLETPQYAFRIIQFASAYDAERKPQKTIDAHAPYQYYEFYTPAELATRNPYAKKLVEKGYQGKLFQLLFRKPAFFHESELILLSKYPQDEIAIVLEKTKPQFLGLIRRYLMSFETCEAADAYWHQLLQGENIITAAENTKKEFLWHEELFRTLYSFTKSKIDARHIVSICAKKRGELSEKQEAILQKGFIGPALTLLLSEIQGNNSVSLTSPPQLNKASLFATCHRSQEKGTQTNIQFETANALKSFLREKLTLNATTLLAEIYNAILENLLDDIRWNGVHKLNALDAASFKKLMEFIQFSFPLSTCEAAQKAIDALASTPPVTPYCDTSARFESFSQLGFSVTGY